MRVFLACPLLLLVAPNSAALLGDWAFEGDWLVDHVSTPVSLDNVTVQVGPRDKQQYCSAVALQNGLLARVFTTCDSVGWTTWDLTTAAHGSALRAMSPEAIVTLDNVTYYIGGAVPVEADRSTLCPAPKGLGPAGACPVAFMNRSQGYVANTSAFQYVSHKSVMPEAPFPWIPGSRHTRNDTAWPPKGLRLDVTFAAPKSASPRHAGIIVVVHYELYAGTPIMSKWLTVLPPASFDADTTASQPEVHQAPDAKELPPSQRGPVFIAPCGQSAAGAQSWLLPGVSNLDSAASFGSPIFLANHSMSPGDAACLSVVKGTARHSFNDKTDVLPCPPNTADPHQLWTFNSSAASAVLMNQAAKNTCADINNHQALDDTVVQVDSCSHAWTWRSRDTIVTKQGVIGQLESQQATGQCLTYKCEAPPAPPKPPPPLPAGTVILSGVVVETLRVNEPWAPTEPRPFDPFYGSGSDFDDQGPVSKTRALSGFLYVHASQRHGTFIQWTDDPTFEAAYAGNIGANEGVLTVAYEAPSPSEALVPGEAKGFDSFHALMLFSDSSDRERSGLGRRKLVRLLAPQTSEAPLFMHLTDATPKGIRSAVDQIVTLGGFDMIIFSFGSGFQLENVDPAYLSQMKESISYANKHGIEVGGYDLISDTRSGTGYDAIDPTTGVSSGNACFASKWAEILTGKAERFINATGLSMLETDGPYAGNPCAATDHEHHRDVRDSVQAQWRKQADFYARMRELGIFLHAPDDYFFEGGANKCVLGYSEMMFNLPRDQWLAITRAQVYDDTWVQTPTQGWMFAPLVPYHGSIVPGAAQLEPLSEHIVDWEWTLATFIGAGVGACYRGDRLFDTPEVQAMVHRWSQFWLKYRRILTEDIIHVRRPSVSEIDCILHVSSALQHPNDDIVGLAMVYNPTPFPVNTSLALPLYYAGLSDVAFISEGEGSPKQTLLNRKHSASVHVELASRAITYFVVRKAESLQSAGKMSFV